MPSLAVSSTITCCTSRDPPSPDGLSPRPAMSPVKLQKGSLIGVSEPPPPSASSAEALELRASVFADGKGDSSIAEVSNSFHGNSKSHALLDEASEESKRAIKAAREKKSISSLNLSIVKQKLKKHLSRESALNKRHSRSSVGTSEEEIERRAELRRIRQKRIQEELSDKGLYDEDAKSFSSNQEPLEGRPKRASWVPGNSLPLPSLKALALPLPALPLPKLNPIDSHQDSLDEPSQITSVKPTMKLVSCPTDITYSFSNDTGTVSRRHSSPALYKFPVESQLYIPSRKQSSIPSLPPTPSIAAQRLPSISVPDKSSWRLSFASPNRGDHLRKLSQGNQLPLIPPGEVVSSGPQPTNRWLHRQGLRSPSHTIKNTGDSFKCAGSSAPPTSVTLDDFGGVDGPREIPMSPHLYEMNIHSKLSSKYLQTTTSSPQLSLWSFHQHKESSTDDGSQMLRPKYAHHRWNTSESIPLSERIPHTWGRVVQDGASSFYPSTGNSIQPSPQSSRFNLMALLTGSRARLDCEQLIDPVVMYTDLVTSETPKDIMTILPAPSTPYARRSTIDNSSILASETDSFREREAELKAVQSRFIAVDTQRTPCTPKSSRFKEEFDAEPLKCDEIESKPRKQSAFARLTRFATRNYDGANGMEDLLAVPMPNFEPIPSPLRGSGMLSPLSDASEVSAIWGKAVKSTAEERASDVGSNLHIPRSSSRLSSHGSRKKSSIGDGLRKLSWGKVGRGKSKKSEYESAAMEYSKRLQERLAVKELVLDDWEAEMAATAQRAKARSRNIVKKAKQPTGPDRRFPLSWSRYPSHSRGERTFSAGQADLVQSQDFAMRINEAGEKVFHQCKEIGDLHLHDDDPEWHKHATGEMGLRARVGDKISQKVYQLETHGGGSRAFEFQTDGRRGSMMVASKKEFPELEILPLAQIPTEDDSEVASEQRTMNVRDERKKIAAKIASYGDGVFDDECYEATLGDSMGDDMETSIADPRFYDDCVVEPTNEDDSDTDELVDIRPLKAQFLPSKERFGTWNGRDGTKYTYRSRNMSLGTMALRNSTDEYHFQLEEAVKLEKDRVLKTVEAAWGSGQH